MTEPAMDLDAQARHQEADQLRRMADRIDHPPEQGDPDGPMVLTGHELFALEPKPVTYRVEPIIPDSRQGAVYGGPGVGKSMLMRAIAGGVAAGAENVLGRYMAAAGRILWVTREEDNDELRRGFAMVAAGSGYDLDALLDALFVVNVRGHDFSLDRPDHREWIESLVRDIEPVFAVFDSMASLSGHDLKDDQAIMPLILWGARLTTAYETVILWIAHDRKGNPQATNHTSDLDDLFGSRQVSAQLDFAYRLLPVSGQPNERTLRCTKMRGAAQPDNVRLELVVRPDELFGFRAIAGVSACPGMSQVRDTVRAYLVENPGSSMSRVRDTVAKQLNRRPVDIAGVVHDLIAQGKIRNQGNANRFALSWVEGEPCPTVSHRVPDTPGSTVSLMSHHPPLGGVDHGTRDPTPVFECAAGCGAEVGGPNVICAHCRAAGER